MAMGQAKRPESDEKAKGIIMAALVVLVNQAKPGSEYHRNATEVLEALTCDRMRVVRGLASQFREWLS